jgi:hypothetical protein
MIVSNNSRMFGLTHFGVVKCATFSCTVCTAPDGMFKGCSTIFNAFDGDVWNHSPHRVLVARALLHPTLPKKMRETVHRMFLEHLDDCGNRGCDLAKALDEVFTNAKSSGAIVDSINNAHELWVNNEAEPARFDQTNGEGGGPKATLKVPVLNTLFDFRQFKLDQEISDFTGLEELSRLEYAALKRTFKDETTYNAPPANFLGRSWQLILGTVRGRIYKIAAFISLPTKQEADSRVVEAHQYCKDLLGPPSEKTAKHFIWDTKDGNVVLQTTTKGLDGFLVSIFLTSASVRHFEPR